MMAWICLSRRGLRRSNRLPSLESIIPIGIIAAAFAGGKIADSYATSTAKEKILRQIEATKNLRWHQFIAEKSYSLYANIFDSRGSTKQFLYRSILTYLLIVFVGILFLYILFPTTFVSATSIWQDGSAIEIASWILCLLLGALVYVFANAQTLYFLEILKSSPSPFKFMLVAYADLLITASISVFCIPLLSTLQTYTVTYLKDSDLQLELKFDRLLTSPVIDMARMIDPTTSNKKLRSLVDETDNFLWFDVGYRYIESAKSEQISRSDFNLAKKAIAEGLMPAAISKDGTAIQYLNGQGDVTGYRTMTSEFSDTETTHFEMGKLSVDDSIAKFCRDFVNGINSDRSFVKVDLSSTSKKEIISACLNEKTITVDVGSNYNTNNIDFSAVYNQYIFQSVGSIISDLTHPFSTYLNYSPVFMLADTNAMVWKHVHTIGDKETRGQIVFDKIMLKSRLWSDGGYHWFRNRSIPVGTIHFAVMSTALFNMTVMLIYFFAFPAIRIIQSSDSIRKYLNLDDNPFTFAFTFVGVIIFLITSFAAIL